MNSLVVSDLKTEISVGVITSNAAELLAIVKNGVQKYFDENYIPNEATAKADRAELNRVEKAIASQASQIKAAYNAPLEEFNGIVSEIRTSIKEAVQVVDNSVKNYEEKQKEKKGNEIAEYFETKSFDLVPLKQIFDSKWLNKTYKMADIKKEIDNAIETIYSNIKVLESIAEYGTTAKAFYLDTLDMGEAMRKVDTLKANAERLAREKVEREERERQEQIARNAAEERQEEKAVEKAERRKSLVDEALGIETEPVEVPEKPKRKKFALEFDITDEERAFVKKLFTENGIAYRQLVQTSDGTAWQ